MPGEPYIKDTRSAIAFLRVCVMSGERLSMDDNRELDAVLAALPPVAPDGADLDVETLRAWLIEQAREAHYLADHPDGQPGDPGGYFDKGAAHMADATLTWISEQSEAARRSAALRAAIEGSAE